MITDAYLAGLFDGEGHIGCAVQRKLNGQGRNVNLRVVIAMGQSALPLLMEINAQYGGRLCTSRRVSGQMMHYLQWQNKVDMISVLSKLEPYLRVKKEQALLGVYWAEMLIVDELAKDMFIAALKGMKSNMMLTADATIKRIQEHLSDKKVVPIR